MCSVERDKSELVLPNTGESSLVPPSDFVSEVKVSLVLLDRSTESGSALHTRVRWIRDRAERIHRLEVAIAQEAEDVPVKIIRPRARDAVHHAAGGAAIFRGVTVGDDLKLLHRFLGNGRAHAIDGIIGR